MFFYDCASWLLSGEKRGLGNAKSITQYHNTAQHSRMYSKHLMDRKKGAEAPERITSASCLNTGCSCHPPVLVCCHRR